MRQALASICPTKLQVRTELPGPWLGLARQCAVGIDADAAGIGWAINRCEQWAGLGDGRCAPDEAGSTCSALIMITRTQ